MRAVEIEIMELIDIAYGQLETTLFWSITKVIMIAERLHMARRKHNVSEFHQYSRTLVIRVDFAF